MIGMKNAVITVLKLVVAATLLYYLFHTGKLTPEPFLKLWSKPWLVVFGLAYYFVIVCVNNYRWILLLKGQKIETSMAHTLPLTFISLFGSLFLPGTVGGDLIKGYYIIKDRPSAKMAAAASVLMDRVVGLFAMGLLAALALIANYSTVMSTPQLKILGSSVFAFVIAMTVFLSICFSRRIRGSGATNKVLAKLPASQLITRVYDTIHDFNEGRKEFIYGIILSLFVQSFSIACLFYIATQLDYVDITLSSFFFVVPLGQIIMSVPISPAGLGVGQFAFAHLFEIFHVTYPDLGATMISIMQGLQVALSLVGAYFYFTRKSPAPSTI